MVSGPVTVVVVGTSGKVDVAKVPQPDFSRVSRPSHTSEVGLVAQRLVALES